MRVAWTIKEADYTLLVAEKMGYFEKYGLDVEPVFYNATSQAVSDMAGAKIDGGLLTIGDLILASGQTDVKGVMVYDSGAAYSIVASPDIKSVRGLRDKRLGVNLSTSGEMFITYMLSGVSMNTQNIRLFEMAPDQVPQSIPSVIDAGLVWEPYTSEALRAGNVLLYKSDRYSSLIPGLIVFRQAIVEQRPEDIRAFIQAWNEAVDYRTSHPQEVLILIMQETGLTEGELGITGKDKLCTVEDNLALFAENPGKDASSIYYITQFNLDFFIRVGDITKPTDIEILLDPSYLK
jgi:NitT/TauT family transport system substrate-binding protein